MTPADKASQTLRAGWLLWGMAALFYAYGFLQRVAPAVIATDLMRDFALGGALLGTLSAAYFYAYAAVQIPAGLLMDRIGPGRLLAFAALFAAMGAAIFGFAPDYALAVLGRAMVGAGVGVAYIGSLKIAALHLPPERFGLIAGLTLTAGTLGAILGQTPLALLVGGLGWRGAMLATSLVGLLLALLVLVLRRGGPRKSRAAGPPRAVLASILHRRETWLLIGITGSLGPPILAFAGLWGVPFLQQVYGMSPASAGLLSSAMLLAWAAGGPLMGAFSDRLGRRPVLVGGSLLQLAAWAVLSSFPPVPLLAAALVVLGLGGGCMVVAFAFARDRFGDIDAATASGIVNTAVLLVGAGMQTLLGMLLDVGWLGEMRQGTRIYPEPAWRLAWMVVVMAPLLGAVLAWRLPRHSVPRGGAGRGAKL